MSKESMVPVWYCPSQSTKHLISVCFKHFWHRFLDGIMGIDEFTRHGMGFHEHTETSAFLIQ
jgi:hypothetical protein